MNEANDAPYFRSLSFASTTFVVFAFIGVYRKVRFACRAARNYARIVVAHLAYLNGKNVLYKGLLNSVVHNFTASCASA